ncbi:hypothetical protein F5B21DRAFT_506652 [Xylaria acuta]|nr:hypothetical protein F5B21DRAFT_506652 [Xylaria acuta]
MIKPKGLWREARNPPADPTGLSFQNKAVLVTGVNSGFGYAAAVKYAALSATPLILAVRPAEKCKAARASTVRETKHSGQIITLILEPSNFASVNAFADWLDEKAAKLDVALFYAGIILPDYKTSSGGYELTTKVNLLSNTLFALRLLLRPRAAAASSDGTSLPHLCFLDTLPSHVVNPEWLPPAG